MSEMRRKVLDKIIRETLFEDVTSYVARGIYDRPIGNAGLDDDESQAVLQRNPKTLLSKLGISLLAAQT